MVIPIPTAIRNLCAALLIAPDAANGPRQVALLFAVEIGVAVAAWFVWRLYRPRWEQARFVRHVRSLVAPVCDWQSQKFSCMALADAALSVAEAIERVDRRVADGCCAGAAKCFSTDIACATERFDNSVADRGVRLVAGAVESLSMPVRLVQNGRLRTYLLWIVAGLAAICAYCLFRAAP